MIKHVCNFCGKDEDQVEHIITNENENTAICNECVLLCVKMIKENTLTEAETKQWDEAIELAEKQILERKLCSCDNCKKHHG